MNVEREIAGIVLPFAVAVTMAVYAECSFCYGLSYEETIGTVAATASAALILIGGTLLLLLHPAHKKWSRNITWAVIAIALGSTGWLCGATSQMMAAGMSLHPGKIVSIALSAGEAMQDAIDSIPFTGEDTCAIIKALLTGERSDIPAHINSAFRDSGASHILSLSGLHLGIIYGILTKVLCVLGNSPRAVTARSVLIIISCGFYTLATGACESIVRSFIFILLGECARLSGRYRSTGCVLLASLIIQLTMDPQAARSVGFQLSYAAMAGIAFIFPFLQKLWPSHADQRRDPIRWIWNSAAMSIACQLTTGPLAYYYFQSFPIHFLLTNIIAIPLTGAIIPISLITLVMSSLGICPEIMIRATDLLVQALSTALSIIAEM